MTVRMQPETNAGQKPTPPRSKAGISKNNGKDGKTCQKVASICEAIRAASAVSRHNQMTAMIEINGREATRAPKAGLRLAVSATRAASRPDNAALIAK